MFSKCMIPTSSDQDNILNVISGTQNPTRSVRVLLRPRKDAGSYPDKQLNNKKNMDLSEKSAGP